MAKKNKIDKMFKRIRNEYGINKEAASVYVSRCMNDTNILFTDGDLFCAMRNTYSEAQVALKDFPKAQIALKKHFGVE